MVQNLVIQTFTSASTAGIVYCELGFQPDFAIFIASHGDTNPNVFIWLNNDRFSSWADALALLITGSSGVITRSTSAITTYDGNELISTTETADSSPKHVHGVDGTYASAGRVTSEGLTIPAALQGNGDANVVIAFRAGLLE